MKKIIKFLSIIVVAMILLSACKKEDEVTPMSETEVKMKYEGSYFVGRNVDCQGNDSYTNENSFLIIYEFMNDSVKLGIKQLNTGQIAQSLPVHFDYTTTGDTVNLFLNDVKLYELRETTAPYDLIVREIFSTQPFVWTDHYLKKM